METQKVILPFFYALFHAGFSSEYCFTTKRVGITFRIRLHFFRKIRKGITPTHIFSITHSQKNSGMKTS